MSLHSMGALLARTVNVDYLTAGQQFAHTDQFADVIPDATYMVSRWDFPADLHCKGSALPSLLAKLPGASYTLSGGHR